MNRARAFLFGLAVAVGLPTQPRAADPLRPGGGFVHGNSVVSTSDLRWVKREVPEGWSASATLPGVLSLTVALGLLGAWIGSRRPSLGIPAGFVLGTFSSLAVVLVVAVILGL
jgi:hypothetical protein